MAEGWKHNGVVHSRHCDARRTREARFQPHYLAYKLTRAAGVEDGYLGAALASKIYILEERIFYTYPTRTDRAVYSMHFFIFLDSL